MPVRHRALFVGINSFVQIFACDALSRGSLRYGEAVELADALGYDIIWKKRER